MDGVTAKSHRFHKYPALTHFIALNGYNSASAHIKASNQFNDVDNVAIIGAPGSGIDDCDEP